MDEVWEALSSPVWWLSVVVVGILMNLAARRLDGWLGKVWKRWAERRREGKAEVAAYIEDLRKDKHKQIMVGVDFVGRLVIGGVVTIFAGMTLFDVVILTGIRAVLGGIGRVEVVFTGVLAARMV